MFRESYSAYVPDFSCHEESIRETLRGIEFSFDFFFFFLVCSSCVYQAFIDVYCFTTLDLPPLYLERTKEIKLTMKGCIGKGKHGRETWGLAFYTP